MATIDIREPIDMTAFDIYYGAVTSYGRDHITITAGQAVTRYTGHFTFDSNGVYGQLNGITQTVAGRTAYIVSGLNLDAYRFVQTMDDGDAEGVLSAVLGGNDRISGSYGNDTLLGLAGSDTLIGNGGDDLLIGQGSMARMEGGAGNDRYVIDDARDLVIEGANGGTDTVAAAISHRMGANVENLLLTGGAVFAIGNALNNQMTGSGGNNILDGGLGRDTLVGGFGNDTYDVTQGDSVTELPSGGTDTVRSAIGWSLALGVENLRLTGSAAVHGTGNLDANLLIGNAGANLLDGRAGNDNLSGGAGNDTLRGNWGDDVLTGGAGADRFVFNGGRDVVTDFQDGLDAVMLDGVTLGFDDRAEALAACKTWGDGIMVDGAGGNDLIVRGVTLDEFRDSFVLV